MKAYGMFLQMARPHRDARKKHGIAKAAEYLRSIALFFNRVAARLDMELDTATAKAVAKGSHMELASRQQGKTEKPHAAVSRLALPSPEWDEEEVLQAVRSWGKFACKNTPRGVEDRMVKFAHCMNEARKAFEHLKEQQFGGVEMGKDASSKWQFKTVVPGVVPPPTAGNDERKNGDGKDVKEDMGITMKISYDMATTVSAWTELVMGCAPDVFPTKASVLTARRKYGKAKKVVTGGGSFDTVTKKWHLAKGVQKELALLEEAGIVNKTKPKAKAKTAVRVKTEPGLRATPGTKPTKRRRTASTGRDQDQDRDRGQDAEGVHMPSGTVTNYFTSTKKQRTAAPAPTPTPANEDGDDDDDDAME